MIQISLKFVSKGPVDNKSSLVQVVAWCWIGNKPLHEPMITQVKWHIYASLDPNKLDIKMHNT